MEANTAITLTELVEKHGAIGVSVILALALCFVAVKFYKILMSRIDELRKQVDENKKAYTNELKAIIQEMKDTIKSNTDVVNTANTVIAQNNKIIEQFIQWRKK